MRVRFSVFASSLLAVAVFAGCLGGNPPGAPIEDDPRNGLTDVRERHQMPFNTTWMWSQPLEKGPYDLLPVESVYVDVDLPVEVGGAALTGDARIHMGIFRPDVPDGVKVPVIADIGPYYGENDNPATEPSTRLGRFLIENFVQHGYAVAQVSVFGTGQSNHCMDWMGRSEQLGVDAAVTGLGKADWSNGNVGLIGKSYDGSTPWQAAMFGNPHLKTIVPISGLIGVHELLWKNGTAEYRGPIMHNAVYGDYGIDSVSVGGVANVPPQMVRLHPDEEDWQNLCRDYLLGPVEGVGAVVTGDHLFPEANHYWAVRNFLPRVLEDYNGSVYLIQGMQDWNVKPNMAFPTHHRLEEAGIEVKGLYGQWGHHYPDQPSEQNGLEAYPESVRFDWAQDLLEWFNHYLQEDGAKPPLHAEVQDHRGQWRLEDSYPPQEVDWTVLEFTGSDRVDGDGVVSLVSDPEVFEFGPFEEELRIAGMPRLHMFLTPTGPGGQVFAILCDKIENLRLGHAVMDLRYHEGGKESQVVVPGVPIEVKMEFFPMDVVVPEGHDLELKLIGDGIDYWYMLYPPWGSPSPVLVDSMNPLASAGMSEFKLPVKTVSEDQFFLPPPWEPENPPGNGGSSEPPGCAPAPAQPVRPAPHEGVPASPPQEE